MIKYLCCWVMIHLSASVFGQQAKAPLKQPMFRDLKVTNSITRSIRDTVFTFHVEAVDDVDREPDLSCEYFWFHQGEIRKTQGSFTGKLLHGPFEKFDRDGYLLAKGHFDHGLKDGVWLNWYTNGKISQRYYWREGYRTGKFAEYYPSGALLKTGKFKHGGFHGTVTYYEPGGAIAREEKYVRGKVAKVKEKGGRFSRKKKSGSESTSHPGNGAQQQVPEGTVIQPAQSSVEMKANEALPADGSPAGAKKRLFRRSKKTEASSTQVPQSPGAVQPQTNPASTTHAQRSSNTTTQPSSSTDSPSDQSTDAKKKKRKKRKQADASDTLGHPK